MGKKITPKKPNLYYVFSSNADQFSRALGGYLVCRGIKRHNWFLPNSQGYANYMGRYIISQFQGLIEIASLFLRQKHPMNRGSQNFKKGILKARKKEGAKAIGIANSCLRETINHEEVKFLKNFKPELRVKLSSQLCS